MRRLLLAALAAAAMAPAMVAAPAPAATTADPTCVQTAPVEVSGHQVAPGVYQCLPPL